MGKEHSMIFAIVDDDAEARQVVLSFLQTMEEAWPFEFTDGQSALEFFKENRVDFIISDWEMPGMNGLELLKHVRITPGTAKVPFIMIASQMSNEAIKIEDAKSSGADAYLIKPFRKHLLMEKISDILFHRKWARQKAAVVIDDDDVVRAFIADAMKQLGFAEVYEAKDGNAGYQCIEDHLDDVSVVICDWEMPEMSGIELLRKCRTTRAMARVPFIMATAQTPEEQKKVELAIQSEVDHYLLKPFRIKDLKEKVEQVLAKAKSRAYLDHLFSNATLALEARDFTSAERLYNQVLEGYPDNSKAHLGLAEVELGRASTKNVKDAIVRLERAIAGSPRWDVPYIRLASVYEKEINTIEKAIECLRNAAVAAHASADIHYQLGRLLIKRGRPDEGLEELKRAIELNPKHADAIALMADPSKAKKDK